MGKVGPLSVFVGKLGALSVLWVSCGQMVVYISMIRVASVCGSQDVVTAMCMDKFGSYIGVRENPIHIFKLCVSWGHIYVCG